MSRPARIAPMLVTSGPLPRGPQWRYEVKWDGIRAIVIVDDRLVVTSRHGTDLTCQLPELEGLTTQLPSGTVLDAELVCLDADARPDFPAVLSRTNRTRSAGIVRAADVRPCHLMVFDVLTLAGQDLTPEPWHVRRDQLDTLTLDSGPTTVVPYHADPDALLAATAELALEGIVAKDVDAPYRPGVRSSAWVKRKHYRHTAAAVSAVERRHGRLYAVEVCDEHGSVLARLRSWQVEAAALQDGMPDGDGVVAGLGPIVVVRHLATAGMREATIIAVRRRSSD